MQSLFAATYVDEIAVGQRDGGEALVQQKLAALSVGERSPPVTLVSATLHRLLPARRPTLLAHPVKPAVSPAPLVVVVRLGLLAIRECRPGHPVRVAIDEVARLRPSTLVAVRVRPLVRGRVLIVSSGVVSHRSLPF